MTSLYFALQQTIYRFKLV